MRRRVRWWWWFGSSDDTWLRQAFVPEERKIAVPETKRVNTKIKKQPNIQRKSLQQHSKTCIEN
jgi:hypothetical protein